MDHTAPVSPTYSSCNLWPIFKERLIFTAEFYKTCVWFVGLPPIQSPRSPGKLSINPWLHVVWKSYNHSDDRSWREEQPVVWWKYRLIIIHHSRVCGSDSRTEEMRWSLTRQIHLGESKIFPGQSKYACYCAKSVQGRPGCSFLSDICGITGIQEESWWHVLITSTGLGQQKRANNCLGWLG